MEPIIIDLPDFIPEEYTLRFKIAGRQYEFSYAEATVDEVFRIMAQDGMKDVMESRKKAVLGFLKKCLKTGSVEQLEHDLALLPSFSTSNQLDIATIYEKITQRVKKNEPGAAAAAK